ncbi:pyridoxamine 5'-phosphate oxidase family protein [Microbacterium deminutum]|uniref:Pyridoxamine 5'-phosphate oxidase family protein n=1 Tax=Microbacterium deminutum TaxID=344164 RepID=A0ABP5BVX1_9MICO
MNTSSDRIRTPSEAHNAPGVATGAAGRPEHGAVEHLATSECWRLIEARSFGRLAVEGLDGLPDVFPLNYTVHDGSIYVKTGPGSKLMAIAVHPVAALEIDGEDDGFHWSVVLRGAARRLAMDKEIRESGVRDVLSSSPTGKYHYICLTPSSISGRRFASSASATPRAEDPPIMKVPTSPREPTRPYEDTVEWPDPDSLNVERPLTPAPSRSGEARQS